MYSINIQYYKYTQIHLHNYNHQAGDILAFDYTQCTYQACRDSFPNLPADGKDGRIVATAYVSGVSTSEYNHDSSSSSSSSGSSSSVISISGGMYTYHV
jgi:hypothetical protein